MMQKKKPKSFEAALARIEEITARLESGEAGLEESIALYTEGMEMAGYCTQKLAEAEKKITVLRQKGADLAEIDFDAETHGDENNAG